LDQGDFQRVGRPKDTISYTFLVIVYILINSSCYNNNTEFKGPIILFYYTHNIQIVYGKAYHL
jgi:hypothetical protein